MPCYKLEKFTRLWQFFPKESILSRLGQLGILCEVTGITKDANKF